MSSETELPSGGVTGRLIAFYIALAALLAVVLVVVIDRGASEKALPAIAGGYVASAPSTCLGPAPAPVGGAPLPPTAPTQLPPPGPAFSVNQSGQFVNLTNNQRTLGGQLRLHPGASAAGAHRLTGTVNCVSGKQQTLSALVVPGVKGSIAGTLGGATFAAVLKSPPPAPGAALPRAPVGIAGKYGLSPTSTCFGSSFTLNGSGSSYTLVAANHTLGRLAYTKKTSSVSGDVACTKGGSVRLTATANDILLQNVKLIPLQVATPVLSSAKPPAKPTQSFFAKLAAKPALITPSGLPPAGEQFTATKQRSAFTKLVAAFFLAVLIVLIVARLFGMVAVRVGQPRVMGEVIAGIALGPSLFGVIAPNLQATIFSTDILPAFGVAANLGLIFFMFLIGMEVDQKQLKGKAAPAAAISNASIALPMLLGIAAALPLYKLLGPNIKFAAFALFMGVAMSITAFPVLARILTERRMLKSPVGSLTIGCAAIDDVSAWFLIALATTIAVSGSFGVVARTIAEAVAFVLVMAILVRRILARMATAFDEVGQIPSGWFAAIVIGVLLSAYITEAINIDVIFGGFIMGMVMPRHARLTEEVTRRVEDFVVTLLLPLFFVYTGLKTNITLLDRPELWLITVGLIGLAIVGKLAGAAIAARVCGFDSRASLVIGTLMNTRGLTELIVLNIALEVGAISSILFTALVIMAIVTTLMTGPLLKLLDPRNEYGTKLEDELAGAAAAAAREHPDLPVAERAILVASHTDAALERLIELAEPLARTAPQRELILTRLVEPPRGAGVRGGLQTENLQLERASQAIAEARERLAADGVLARGVALSSSRPGADLAHVAAREPVDLVLTEGRRRLIGESVPLGDVSVLLEQAECDVAVLVARESAPVSLGPESPVLVPFGGAEHDWAALELGSWLSSATGAPLKLLGAGGQTDEGKSVTRMLADASLLVQQTTGIATEPLVTAGGRDGIVSAAAGAGLLVIGLSERWRREGLGPTRSEIAKAAPAPVLFVRRGTREGLFAQRENVTQFNWSMAGRTLVK
ncbi:MAG TPA: cation:proton antiporter [Solirubrobacteraceae bacterium]|jgi:Kef-type K+ transport system membrane component KefB|nr:cation:proton antiporter [Solirubrobacteraceae bacterium]